MKHKIIFAYKKHIVGGCELLIEKLCRQFIKSNNQVFIAYHECFPEMEQKYISTGANLQYVENWNKPDLQEVNNDDYVYVITFLITDYIRFYNLTNYTKTIIYAVHYKALLYENPFKRTFAGSIVKDISDGNHILCMDEVTDEYTINTYSKQNLKHSDIVRIPIDVVNINNSLYKRRAELNNFNILSISRAEFPFKGYLVGLVKKFGVWAEKYPKLTLTLISYGEDINQLQSAVNELPEVLKQRVLLIGKTDYAELSKYINQAKLYIGMGTTILDASQRGLVSITACAYTYDLIARDFFFKDNTNVGISTDAVQENNIDELVTEVLSWDKDEYIRAEESSRQSVIGEYSSSGCAKRILDQFDKIDFSKSDYGLKGKLLKLSKPNFMKHISHESS